MIDAVIWGLCGLVIATLLNGVGTLWVERRIARRPGRRSAAAARLARQLEARRHRCPCRDLYRRSRDKTVENESQPHSNRS